MSSSRKPSAATGPSVGTGPASAAGVVPAQLGFLAIYNPSLGTTDETIEDQIVYYGGSTVNAATAGTTAYSGASRRRRSSASAAAPTGHLAPDERNERLRQIGLAQGMVAFGRSFAGDQAVDTIETDKTRVILHELEPGWWILASVDLTQLPAAAPANGEASTTATTATTAAATAEYSAREVKPAALLLQDLLRAHSIFLLHHDVGLESLFRRVTPRPRFTVLLSRYWDIFLSSWSVLLHGNPVRDVLPGMRLAASGELGIGVGEEERGSGEREVLEGLIESTDGLVDLVVCKYGDLSLEEAENWSSTGQEDDHSDDHDGDESTKDTAAWLGTGAGLGAEDGAIFLGVGALSRPALRNLTYWMEDIYCWGHDAYAIANNPSAPSRQTRHRKKMPPAMGSISEQHQQLKKDKQQQQQQQQQAMEPPSSLLPPPPVTQLTARRTKNATSATAQTQPIPTPNSSSPPKDTASEGTPSSTLSESGITGGMDKYMSIMKLGYGTYWSLGGSSAGDVTSDNASKSSSVTSKSGSNGKRSRFHNENRAGRFLIPLIEESEEKKNASTSAVDDSTSSIAESEDSLTKPVLEETTKMAPKSPSRTIFVSRARPNARPPSQNTLRGAADGKGKHSESVPEVATPEADKLRVVVYAQRPFLYTFLFEEKSENGTADGEAGPRMSEKIIQTLIDRQLSVLHKPLLSSTAYRPDKPSMVGAAAMLNVAVAPSSASASGSIYDLVWDPNMLTIHSTIPNIPDPYAMIVLAAEAKGKPASKKELAKLQKLQQAAPTGLPQSPPWSRVEALNTHMQILNLYAATRNNGAELERMCKTSRGWWIVWNRLVERSAANDDGRNGQGKYGSTLFEEDEEESEDHDGQGGNSDTDDDTYQRAPSDCDSDDTALAQASALGTYTVRKEIILIRKASDHVDNAGLSSRGAASGEATSSSGSGLLGMGRASSAMRAFSASAYLGFGSGSSGSGGSSAAVRGTGDAAAAEVAAAVGDRGAGWADGASRLAQGIGVDTKKYIEGLLTLNK